MTALALIAALAGFAAAIADPARPEADRARDAARKPEAVLEFAKVKPGDQVGEYMPGGGYFTRLLSPAVGTKGHVYAYPPSEIVKLVPRYLADAEANAAKAPLKNVTVLTGPNGEFGGRAPLDVVFTAQNYHDLHTRYAPAGAAQSFNAAVFKALKHGGHYVIIDHAAAPGTGVTNTDALHRIDPAAVRTEVEAAGFRFDAESQVLADPADPRTANVFDPGIRGRTDQFALRFRKP